MPSDNFIPKIDPARAPSVLLSICAAFPLYWRGHNEHIMQDSNYPRLPAGVFFCAPSHRQ